MAKTLDMKHKGACDCVTVAKDIILTGGKDGVIFVMDKSYSKKCEIDCSAVFKNSVLSSIRSIDID